MLSWRLPDRPCGISLLVLRAWALPDSLCVQAELDNETVLAVLQQGAAYSMPAMTLHACYMFAMRHLS